METAGLAGGLAWLTRKNLAAVRLWIWRIAALKFLLPLDLLFALGAWIGYPVRHSAVPPPALLAIAVGATAHAFAPAQTAAFTHSTLVLAMILAIISATACVVWIFRKERFAREDLDAENSRAARDWSDRPPPPGFLRAATLFGASDTTWREVGMPLSLLPGLHHHREACVRLAQAVGKRSFDTAYRAGARMSLEEAVSFALEDRDEIRVGSVKMTYRIVAALPSTVTRRRG